MNTAISRSIKKNQYHQASITAEDKATWTESISIRLPYYAMAFPKNLLLPSYNFIPSALCTLNACLMLKSNIISSLPPGIAYALTSLYSLSTLAPCPPRE